MQFANRYIIVGLLLLMSIAVVAQAPPVDWNRALGGSSWEELHSINPTSDGGFLVAAITQSEPSGDVRLPIIGNWDFWIVKLDEDGKEEWQQRYGGKQEDRIWISRETRDGGYIIGGSSNSNAGADKSEDSRGDHDFWLMKLDQIGNLEWERTIGGDGFDSIRGDILETDDGGYLLAGVSSSGISGEKSEANRGEWDFWVVKVDSRGTVLWDKTYGGDDKEVLLSVLPMEDGGFLLGGNSESDISGDKDDFLRGLNDFWIVRIDANGEMLWQKTMGGIWDDGIFDMVRSEDDIIYMCGFSGSTASFEKTNPSYGSRDYWVVAIDLEGNILWDNNYGGQQSDSPYDVRLNKLGNLVIAGISSSDVSGSKTSPSQGAIDYWVVYIDPEGNQIWDQSYGASRRDALTELEIATDGSLLLAGHSESGEDGDKTEAQRGVNDIWLVKTSCDLLPQLPDTVVVCQIDDYELVAAFGRCYDCSYEWNNTNTQEAQTIQLTSDQTLFTVAATDINACTNIDQTLVSREYPRSLEVSFGGEFCEPNFLIEQVNGGNPPYLFAVDTEPYNLIQTYASPEVGIHTVYVMDSLGCMLDTTIIVAELDSLTVNIGEDVLLELGENFELQATTSRPAQIQWDADFIICIECPVQTVIPVHNTLINVTAEDQFGCIAQDEVFIRLKKDYEIFIPNAFSPDNDGNNDFFDIFAGDDVAIIKSMQIFDRWGQHLFHKENLLPNQQWQGWDGYAKDRLVSPGIYIYVLEVEFIDGHVELFTGDVTLMP